MKSRMKIASQYQLDFFKFYDQKKKKCVMSSAIGFYHDALGSLSGDEKLHLPKSISAASHSHLINSRF